jgi:predicted ABC-type ATPase
MPVFTVFAGPNGSGKSSITSRRSFEGKENLLDPDAVAKRLNPLNPSAVAVSAAREVIARTRTLLDSNESFAVETTLSGRNYLEVMEAAKRKGYFVRLLFICLDRPTRNSLRVSERVLKGGHFVPEADVIRRYDRSLANLPAALKIADHTLAFDNSGPSPRKVFEANHGVVSWKSITIPEWARKALTACQP